MSFLKSLSIFEIILSENRVARHVADALHILSRLSGRALIAETAFLHNVARMRIVRVMLRANPINADLFKEIRKLV